MTIRSRRGVIRNGSLLEILHVDNRCWGIVRLELTCIAGRGCYSEQGIMGKERIKELQIGKSVNAKP